jgi:hypothetical protein
MDYCRIILMPLLLFLISDLIKHEIYQSDYLLCKHINK